MTVSSDGEKAIIIFTVLNCGTAESDTELIDVLYRGIGGVAPKGFELGTGVQTFKRPKTGSRRKSNTSQSSEDVKSMREMIDLAKSHLSATALPAYSPSQNESLRRTEKVQGWEQKEKLLEMLSKARKMMDNESDPDVHSAWKPQFEGILHEIKKVESDSGCGADQSNN